MAGSKPLNASTERNKRAAVYRKAAQLGELGERDGSCVWVAVAEGLDSPYASELSAKYSKVFNPGSDFALYWGNEWADQPWSCGPVEAARDCRVLALCFMAALVEAGDA